jgi:hypothetical protein
VVSLPITGRDGCQQLVREIEQFGFDGCGQIHGKDSRKQKRIA